MKKEKSMNNVSTCFMHENEGVDYVERKNV